jgi:protein-S-isoprenylcysteine O-methyltransferase Ste14
MTWACFSLFTWIVHDRDMSGWPSFLDRTTRGPLLQIGNGVASAVIVDSLLFSIFGLLHAGAARQSVYKFLGQTLGIVHRQALRTAFMTITAAGWWLVMFFWQPTGQLVWDLRPWLSNFGLSPALVDKAGSLISFGFVLLCLGTVLRHGWLSFIGIRQLVAPPEQSDDLGAYHPPAAPAAPAAPQADSAPKLVTTGIYGVVRHPMYMYLLASVVVRPTLSLDLTIWFVCAAVFLAIALPLEEEKLIAIFGTRYREYRKRTPAIVPFWPMPGR